MVSDPTARAELLREEHAALRREIVRAAVRLEKRVAAVTADLAKIDEAEAVAGRATWLVAAAVKTPRGAESLTISDWSTGVEATFTMPLDPAKTAKEQVDAVFQRARRLRAGRPVAEKRRAEAEETALSLRLDVEAMDAVDLEAPEAEERIEAIYEHARKTAPREIRSEAPTPKKKKKLQERAPPYRTFVGAGGIKILVGKGAAHNDELTLQVAKPHHAWLHARDEAGAHVVVVTTKGQKLTSEQLVDAAHLTAHFSKARGEDAVDVAYTEKRYVRKPRKSPVGSVVVDREKVIHVRIEPERLAALLKSEES
ncbi:MAG: NFACT RNA binding domain-containing protein [Polyangiaceae bacterium]